MARKKKAEVIEALKAACVEFDENGKYNDLCKLLKAITAPEQPTERQTATEVKETAEAHPTTVKITNRIKKLNTFLADAVREERDKTFLNAEISKRKYKGKLKTITTIKHCEVIDGDWVTKFIIELKG